MSTFSDAMRELLNGRHYATLAMLNEDGSMHLTPVWYLFEFHCFQHRGSERGKAYEDTADHDRP
jgi:Pyridoxamine 5'-phosphate oxidase